jgi:hypothetical protein
LSYANESAERMVAETARVYERLVGRSRGADIENPPAFD